MQPLIINLTGRTVIIVGGGRIAARKARVIGDEKANITFIAPDFSQEVLDLATEHNYTLINRKAQPEDLTGALLIILATNDRSANQALYNTLPDDQLTCVVDDLDEGNTTFPATVRRGHLQIAVTSNGSSPKLTRKLKKQLEAQFDHTWHDYTHFLHQCRQHIKTLHLPDDQKHALLWELLDDTYRLNPTARQQKWQSLQK